ncbi:translation initiation factor eIF-2B subunit alpha-like [Physella acuta]|uniref:translation initiation factor eIF-2B subunit alpha-like n=1 Tax=Physella acuta TaxID=109671 RepID=UPI0027DAD985|nr:translation initiation factor eIF-2B subunit alpha-like [Physella acuta]
MNKEEVLNHFTKLMREKPEMSSAVAAISTLVRLMECIKAKTLSELRSAIKDAITVMQTTDYSYASIHSSSEQFLRYTSLTNLDTNFQENMLERGKEFYNNMIKARAKIAKLASAFIEDGATILTHCRSRNVLEVLKAAASQKKRFTVYVTESNPDKSGYQMEKELSKLGIPTSVILDFGIGYVMEKVQLVMVGAEGVMESGGIINKIGTYPIAICARQMNKPFYVVTESFKFVREYPLNQMDVPDQFKFRASTRQNSKDLSKEHPIVDYTPPEYINLLFTDLGVVTSSAVSDELITLYC